MCSLRILAGEEAFDPDHVVDLRALTGGNELVGGGVQGGIPDGRGGIYLSVADEQRYLDGEENAFRLWHWDVATGSARELSDTPWWGAFMSSYASAGEIFAVLPSSETTLVLEASAEPLSWFEMSGWVDPFVRVH